LSSLKRALTSSPRAYRAARTGAILTRYALRRQHEPDLEGFKHFDAEGRVFLDVGANSGQSALSFRIFDRETPIISIEPQRHHEPDLKLVGRVIRNFEYRILALGERDEQAELRVPYYRGVPLSGEASLDPEIGDSTWAAEVGAEASEIEIRSVTVDVKRLDGLDIEPAFIKMDVEEHELPALRGASETLARCRPLLMVERSASEPKVRAHVEALGYAPLAYVKDREGFVPLDEARVSNAFYVPEEKPYPAA